jgi:PadR family transcriptional regulator PadR
MPGPRGRRRWRGGRGVQRGQIARMVEPCLLTLLQEAPRHGYELISTLERFGLEPEMLDSAMVYRTLRQMEQAGWVVSTWETSGTGPARRVYDVTAAGREALVRWREQLGQTHEFLHRLLGHRE